MLDRDAGSFRLGPSGISVPAARRYLPGTMVLETSWGTGSGWIIVRDALLIGGWHHEDERSGTHRRAPTDYDADHVLLRTIRCVNGQVEIVMDCEPVFDYGTKQRRTGSTPAPATTRAWRRRPAPTSGSGCAPTCGSASRARARPPATA